MNTLSFTPVGGPRKITACDVCQIQPQPRWAVGSCEACQVQHAKRSYFTPARVGPRGMHGPDPFQGVQPKACYEPGKWGYSWQHYGAPCRDPQ